MWMVKANRQTKPLQDAVDGMPGTRLSQAAKYSRCPHMALKMADFIQFISSSCTSLTVTKCSEAAISAVHIPGTISNT